MDYYTAHSDSEYKQAITIQEKTMSRTIEEFAALKSAWRKQQEELRKEGQVLLCDALQDLFNNNESLKEISWTQYTPWFNDGDTCEFSTYAHSPKVNGWEENSWWYGLDKESDDKGEGEDEEDASDSGKALKLSNELYKEILTILNILDEDDYKEIFGDHVKVVITKEGYEVEEYRHD